MPKRGRRGRRLCPANDDPVMKRTYGQTASGAPLPPGTPPAPSPYTYHQPPQAAQAALPPLPPGHPPPPPSAAPYQQPAAQYGYAAAHPQYPGYGYGGQQVRPSSLPFFWPGH